MIISRNVPSEYSKLLTDQARELIVHLHRKLHTARTQLLENRIKRQAQFDAGALPAFMPETKQIRESDWTVPLDDRPYRGLADIVDWKTTDYGFLKECLQTDANGIQFDFDDSFCPSWENCLKSQLVLYQFANSNYARTQLNERGKPIPTVMVRPRSLNLEEAHIHVDGKPIAGAIFDLAVWCTTWFTRTRGPDETKELNRLTLWIPKVETHYETKWWNEVFTLIENYFTVPTGTMKALVLIENALAAFEMDEILYSMKDHILGLNAGKWDYIFAFIKKLKANPNFLLPERKLLGMDLTFLDTYVRLLIVTCKRRGCLVTGGMAPYVPSGNKETDREIYKKIVAEKRKGAMSGYYGELVAHPLWTDAVLEAYQNREKIANPELLVLPKCEKEIAKLLLTVPKQTSISLDGLKFQLTGLVQYIYHWIIKEEGACVLNGCMEDLATTEINRTLVWQWLRHGARVNEGNVLIDLPLVAKLVDEQVARLGEEGQIDHRALGLVKRVTMDLFKNTAKGEFVGFLPDLMYPLLVDGQGGRRKSAL